MINKINGFQIAELAGRIAFHSFLETQKETIGITNLRFTPGDFDHYDTTFTSGSCKVYGEIKGRKCSINSNFKPSGFMIKKSKYEFLKEIAKTAEPNSQTYFICLFPDGVAIWNLNDWNIESWSIDYQKKTEYGDQTFVEQEVHYLQLSEASHIYHYKTNLLGILQHLGHQAKK